LIMTLIEELGCSLPPWSLWLVIPLALDILPVVAGLFVLFVRRIKNLFIPPLKIYPEISVIIPVYNAENTLEACIRSVYESDYPSDKIFLMAVDNGSTDGSRDIFFTCREKYKDMKMYFLESKQGKALALNMAIYNATGLYTVLIDSDGRLERSALTRMIRKFEVDPRINCMTGSVLTDAKAPCGNEGMALRLLRRFEFMEYARSFFIGRARDAEFNAVYTMSGAFSVFRTTALKRSELFDNDTLCEDTNMTFQMRLLQKERIEVCEDAVFTVAPIESFEKLYTQRQRWQRGSIEVAKQFRGLKSTITLKTLLLDHTFSFPKLLWYFATVFLIFEYPAASILLPLGMIYIAYAVLEMIYFIFAYTSKGFPSEMRMFYLTSLPLSLLMPLYGAFVFIVRVIGIANSFSSKRAWTARSFSEERAAFASVVRDDMEKLGIFTPQKRLDGMGPVEKKVRRIPARKVKAIAVGCTYFIGATVLIVTKWISSNFGIGIEELLRTLTGNLAGTGRGMVSAVIEYCVIPILVCLLAIVIAVIIFVEVRPPKKWEKAAKEIASIVTVFGVTLLSGALIYAESSFGISDYCLSRLDNTTLYEDYYVDPEEVVSLDGEAKNLIYIYIESMETTYASVEEGGIQQTNYIPYLSRLARENVSFSNTERLGGWHTCTGTGWTIASLFSTTTGVPYSMSAEGEAAAGKDLFASGITSLGDILASYGYNQEFLCGSDADFAGRRDYFTQHGGYEIFDLYTARKKGYIPEDYYVWWGYEDMHLFEIAKDEVLRLYGEGEPFNLTMLTVDAHHVGGYVCDLCRSIDDSVTATVVSCTDRQVYEFVSWLSEQEFYDDTLIVISGDHPRMDKNLVGDTPIYDRTVYNCFINAAVNGDIPAKNREFTAVDMFPTLLTAMGFNVKGGRVGLGTDLFSGKKTLAEEKSVQWLDAEFGKSSDYYVEKFTPDLIEDEVLFS